MNRDATSGLTDKTPIQRDLNQSFSRIDDEVVMLSLSMGEYYTLNPVASRIWELLEKKTTPGEIIVNLQEEFEVEPEQCSEETYQCLSEFKNKGLIIEIKDSI